MWEYLYLLPLIIILKDNFLTNNFFFKFTTLSWNEHKCLIFWSFLDYSAVYGEWKKYDEE